MAARVPRAVPRQPGPDQRLGDVLAVEVAPAHPSAVSALLGEVAHHRLPLDQLDHEGLGRDTAGHVSVMAGTVYYRIGWSG